MKKSKNTGRMLSVGPSSHGGIERMRANIRRLQQETARQIAEIEIRIKEKSILLDALRRGRIKQ